MSLTGRFTALFLTVIGLVLVAFSSTVYLSARFYLSRQISERLSSSLAILAAAAEIHPLGVEWEPQERVLPLGQEAGPERLHWLVFDPDGKQIDHSRNLVESELTPEWQPREGNAVLPGRLADRQGRFWRVAQRKVSPASIPRAGSIDRQNQPIESGTTEVFYRSLVLTVCAPLEPMDAALKALVWSLAVSSSAIWLGSVFLCRRLSRSALKPLTRMVDSARGLDATDAGWCLDEPGTGDELAMLGRAFNDLLARLHASFQSQRQFTSDASHQLRTPLTVMIGQMQVAIRQERSVEEYRRALQSALLRAIQLAEIVESLLFLARGDAQGNLPGGEPIELRGWVARFLETRHATWNDRAVDRLGDGEDLWVNAHPCLLEQLLENLLDNAVKHGNPQTPIIVESGRMGENAILAVEDSGPGIAEEDRDRVFEPFYRSETARRRRVPGVGLGLAVVERIATAMGGSISLHSESGRSSRFELRLPLVREQTPASASSSSPPAPLQKGASPSSCTLP